MKLRKAFTLIELLVVIAIIAILAAILFPVLAQARNAAKTTVALSNTKQIGMAAMMYIGDYDDVYFPRFIGTVNEQGRKSWKHVVFPYMKNSDIFKDPVNPLALFPDEFGRPAQLNLGVPAQPIFNRGYFYYQAFHKTGNWEGFGYSLSQIEEPSNSLLISENKDLFVDYGPWMEYFWNGENGWRQPNWGGAKRDDRMMIVVFADGSAKLTPLNKTCVGENGVENMWQYDRTRPTGYPIAGGTPNISWMDTFCTSYRTKRP